MDKQQWGKKESEGLVTSGDGRRAREQRADGVSVDVDSVGSNRLERKDNGGWGREGKPLKGAHV